MTQLSIPVSPIQVTGSKPQSCDVVVVGGGIIGVTAAMSLAEKGLRVVLCEKGVIAGEQSSRNWGWVRQMGRDGAEMPLTVRSLGLWKEMDARIGAETGFRETGIVYAAYRDRDMASWETWSADAATNAVACHRYDGEAAARFVPGTARPLKGVLHTPGDGRAEPFYAVPRMAEYAATLGVTVLESCAARSVETEAGAVSGVVTEQGPIACRAVVVAGGMWSRKFLGNLDIDFPQLRVIASVAQVTGVDSPSEMPTGAGDWAYRKRLDGDFTVAWRNASVAPVLPDNFRLLADYLPTLMTSYSELRLRPSAEFFAELFARRHWSSDQATAFEAARTLDPAPYRSFNRKGLANLVRDVPRFATGRVVREWAGAMDATPDGVPVIDRIAGHPGLFVASGFSGHGFGIGPGAGELIADLVANDTPKVDPAPFRFSRLRAKFAEAA
ncbi:MAG: FAD-binding oxidoreductase [Pseudomonadota bacterium]|nr:FAD-binding oxidoreductase [Pseudomonadota bacterium]